MTTGRWVVLALSLLLAAGCTIQPAGKRTQSAYVQRELSPAFSTVATAAQLGDDWQDTGWLRTVTEVYATLDGSRALLLRTGAHSLWLDGGGARSLSLDRSIDCADPGRGTIYTIKGSAERENDSILTRELPEGSWRMLMASTNIGWPGGRVSALARHALGDVLWANHWLPYQVNGRHLDVGYVTEDGDFISSGSIDRGESEVRTIGPVPLAGGDALIISGDAIWFVSSGIDGAEEVCSLPAGRECQLVADIAEPETAWLLVEPQRGGAGTAREGAGEEPGYLVAFNTHGAELARISTGDVRFTRIFGDWAKRRALLLHPSIGVALANAQTGELTWLLRQGGAAQLQLLPGGQVWAFVPDGIIGIEGDDLIRLAPKLAAEQVLTREQLALIKPAAEALRWQWDDVQLSPLVHEPGQLTLFNAGQVDADWAEFDWDLSRELVSRLLIARRPEPGDLKLPGLSDAQLDEQVLALLSALGWPDAAREAERGTHGADELNAFYRLRPADGEACEFQLWITSGATMLKLSAADDSPAPEPPPDDTGAEPAQ